MCLQGGAPDGSANDGQLRSATDAGRDRTWNHVDGIGDGSDCWNSWR